MAGFLVATLFTLAFSGQRLSLPPLSYGGTTLVVSGPDLTRAVLVSGGDARALSDGGVRVYANLSFGHRVEVREPGATPLHVVARGTPVDGIYPYLTLHVDGEFYSGFFVSSESWGLYRIPLHLTPGHHDLEWSYVNDGSAYPESRNVDLLAVTIGTPPEEMLRYRRWQSPCVIDPSKMAHRDYGDPDLGAYHLWGRGSLADDVYFDRPGHYRVRIAVSRPPPGEEPHRMEVSVDGEIAAQLMPGVEPEVLTAWVDVDAGMHSLAWRYRSGDKGATVGQDLIVRAISIGETPDLEPEQRGPLHLGTKRAWIPGRAIELRPGGEASGSTWTLWSDGYLAQTVRVESNGRWEMVARAWADLCDGQGPRVLVMIDADQLGVLDVDDSELRDYPFPLQLTAGTYRVALVYENDLLIDGRCDRNLHLAGLGFVPEPGRQSATVSPRGESPK